MKSVIGPLVLAACIGSALPAQRMGHSNTHAPQLTQTIDLAGKAALKLGYTSITWASGTWAKALADASKRDKMRERINSAAEESPLGTFETDVALMIGGQHVPKGRFKLSFGLDAQFVWELRLRGSASVSVPLKLTKRDKVRRRLTLNLNSGDEDFSASLHVVFGDQECELSIAPHLHKVPAKKSAAKFINGKCPLMDEAVDPEFSVSYKGHAIGLCCEDCITDWNKLPTAERDEHLAKMLTKKR